jgi:hypothetical protein
LVSLSIISWQLPTGNSGHSLPIFSLYIQILSTFVPFLCIIILFHLMQLSITISILTLNSQSGLQITLLLKRHIRFTVQV